MSLTHRLLLVSSAAPFACGPSVVDDGDWRLDTFTEFGDGAGQVFPYSGLGKLTFDPDGVGTHTNIGACGRDVTETSFSWEPRGANALAIIPMDDEDFVFDTNDHEWRIAAIPGCTRLGFEELALQEVRDGKVHGERAIYRGDLCLERFACTDTAGDIQCNDCRTRWCEEPPLACDGD